MTVSKPTVLIGCDAQPLLLEANVGYVDDDTAYELEGESRAVAPAGPGGECAFHMLYVTTLHYEQNVSVWVTAIVDGIAQPTQRIDLAGVALSDGERKTMELSLHIPFKRLGVEKGRYAPRGTWIEARVETKYGAAESGAAAAAAKQIVESLVLEFEVVREQKQEAAA